MGVDRDMLASRNGLLTDAARVTSEFSVKGDPTKEKDRTVAAMYSNGRRKSG